MGSSLEPVLANEIMTEFERLVVNKLIKEVLYYICEREVKVEDIDNIMKEFNSFDKIIQFIIDRFEDGIVHFLDIRINGSGKDLNHKAAHNEQYCDFSSQTP